MPSASFTTLSLKPSTLRRLRSYKVGGKSYDEVLNEFMDEIPTRQFIEEHLRALKEEPRLPLDRARGTFKG
jgi:hypothetical protein